MTDTPLNFFTGLFQIAYVTTDFERAVDLFRARHGIPRFLDLGVGSRTLDDGQTMTIRVGFCFCGEIQIEIIEPVAGAVDLYRGALPDEGFALVFHHLGFRVESVPELARIRQALAANGQQIVLSCSSGAASSFFYVDALATLGHYLEYLVLHRPVAETWADVPRY